MPIAFNVDSQVESKNKSICFVPHVINSCINFAAQGTIGPGTKLEDGKGTAASGASFPKKLLSDHLKFLIHLVNLSGANSAMKMFQKRDELGTSDMSTKLNTTHQNQVSEVGLSTY